MDPYAPINGVSLERYAELCADVEGTPDPDKQAEIVAKKGVARADWEAAKAGWTARMQDMSLMGAVATRFMPLYQAELAKKSPAPRVTFEDYVGMSAAVPVLGYEGMLAHYKLSGAQWTQIAGHWNSVIATHPQYQQFGILVEREAARIRAGGAPKSIGAPFPQQPWGHPQPNAYAPNPFGSHQQQQSFDRQLNHGLNELGNALSSFGNAIGAALEPSLRGWAPGTRVFVMWSDGNRYPGTVVVSQNGQVQVAFPDGRQIWVPVHVCTPG